MGIMTRRGRVFVTFVLLILVHPCGIYQMYMKTKENKGCEYEE